MTPGANVNLRIAEGMVEHTVNLLRVAAGQRLAVLAILENLEADLAAEVASGKGSFNSMARITALNRECGKIIAQAYDEIGIRQDVELRELAVVESAATVGIVEAAIGIPGLLNVQMTEKQLEYLVQQPIIEGYSSGQWWQSQAAGTRAKFTQQMQQGMLRGESVDELVRRVRGTKAKGFTDGVMDVPKRQAAALVRSSVISTANAASMATIDEMDDIANGIQWLATLDGKTTLICRALSGKKWSIPDHKPIGHTIQFPGATAHWQCRSRQIPWLKSWAEITGLPLKTMDNKTLEARVKDRLTKQGMDPAKVAKVTTRTRASMDGQVPNDLTMDDWLSGKDDAFIEKTLGKGRAAMYRRGEITVSDLVDQTGRPLTTKQLREKVTTGKELPETQGVLFDPNVSKADLRKELTTSKRALVKISEEDAADAARLDAATGRKKKAIEYVREKEPDRPPGEILAKAEGMLIKPSEWET